jgi:PLP dependent protein
VRQLQAHPLHPAPGGGELSTEPASTAGKGEALAGRLAAVRADLAEACLRRGRRPDEVTLVGASKTQPAEALRAAWDAGLRIFGENRVQEALAKAPHLPPELEWHLIGPLQTNKVKAAVGLFRTVHSVDRLRIAEALDREAAARGLRLDVFLEVNLGAEPTKHGFVPEGLREAVRPLADMLHLRVVGLMTIHPPGETPEDARRWFRALRELRDRLGERPEWVGFPGGLSMGMSDDYAVAAEEGATHVRVGTALFGPRTRPV